MKVKKLKKLNKP